MSKEKPKEGVKAENNHINQRMARQDGSVVQFKIKRHTPLGKLMKAYCERQGLSMRQIRFRIDVQPSNEAGTPAQLETEDQDSITCSSSRQEARRSPAAWWNVVSRGISPTLPPSTHLLLLNSEHVTMPITKESAGT